MAPAASASVKTIKRDIAFQWEGMDKKGNRVKGKSLAPDEAALRADLRRQGVAASRIKKLFITDTIEPHQDPLPPNVCVVSVAKLFANAIRSIHDRTSVSQLFPEGPPDVPLPGAAALQAMDSA